MIITKHVIKAPMSSPLTTFGASASLETIVDAEDFGASVGASGAINSMAVQAALDSLAASGGGTLRFSGAGTYLMDATGINSTHTSRRRCVEILGDDIKVQIDAGATVMLADNQQTDATGSTDIFAGDVARSGISFCVDGLLSGNKDNQPGWSGGYGQAGAGGCLVHFKGDSPGGTYTFTGTGRMGQCFSNPIDISGNQTMNGHLEVGPVEFFDCGEGPEGVGFSTVSANVRYILESPFEMAGDAVEFARCGAVHVTNLHVETRMQGAPTAITGITKADPAVVTCAVAHGFSTGQRVKLSGLVGMPEINNAAREITVLNATSFEMDGLDSTAFRDYTSGGTADVMLGKPSGSALETYGCNTVQVDQFTVINWWALTGLGGPSSGLQGGVTPTATFENGTVSGMQAATGMGDGYQTLINANTLTFNTLTFSDSPDCNPFFFSGTDAANPIVFNNVLFDKTKRGSLTGSREHIWHGGGCINSVNQPFQFQATATNETRNINYQNLTFTGSLDNATISSTFANFQILGLMVNCTVDAATVWPGANVNVDYTDLTVTNCTPTIDSGTSEAGPFVFTYQRTAGGGSSMDGATPTEGKVLEIQNRRGANLTIQHDSVGGTNNHVPFFTNSTVNLVLADGEDAIFDFDPAGASGAGFYEQV